MGSRTLLINMLYTCSSSYHQDNNPLHSQVSIEVSCDVSCRTTYINAMDEADLFSTAVSSVLSHYFKSSSVPVLYLLPFQL